MFLRAKSPVPTETNWYSPGANRNASIRPAYGRTATLRRTRRSGLATAGTVVAGTAVSGLVIFWLAYFAAKVVALPVFIVNVGYFIAAQNTPHGMDHFNWTWGIISGLILLLG